MKLDRVEAPEIRYTQSGDVSIAYAIRGQGPIDVVFVHGYMSNHWPVQAGRAESRLIITWVSRTRRACLALRRAGLVGWPEPVPICYLTSARYRPQVPSAEAAYQRN